MSRKPTIEQVNDMITTLLGKLGLKRVVFVDDLYAGEPPLENVLGAAARLEPQTLSKALPELEGPVPVDIDIRGARIRRLWDDLDTPTRRLRAGSIFAAARDDGDTEIDDYVDASLLAELIPQEMLQTLSPQEWEDRRDLLLEEDVEQPTLFLFDQDMSKGGGEVNGGIKIISSILTEDAYPNLICGLLTHTITPENQYTEWEDLSKAHQIPRDRFIVIPKRHIGDEPLVFAQVLKYCALSPDFTKLKAKTKEILEAATDVAADKIDATTIYDLDHMVFQVAADEGLWEPDMLFRLHTLFHRLESRRRAHEAGQLEQIASRLRSVSNIPTRFRSTPSVGILEIERDDLYEQEAHVNAIYLPLDVGDIFERTTGTSRTLYVLLAQPCDLMVRSGGRREPDIAHVSLVEMAPAKKQPLYSEKMPSFRGDLAEQWYVKFRRAHHVHVAVLDLCAFNADGNSILRLDCLPPTEVRPTWKSRHGRLVKWAKKSLKPIELLSNKDGDDAEAIRVKKSLSSQLTKPLLREELFKGEPVLDGDDGICGISYNCRRVGRIASDRAFGLLLSYSGLLGRPGYERGFV